MKIIYLKDENYKWIPFTYENLKDIQNELDKRNIILGYGCTLGNGCSLGNNCNLGHGCNLGYDCNLGDGCNLGHGCNLGYDCNLGDDCNLGYGCNLGDDCNLGNNCNLGHGCNLGYGCNLGDKIKLVIGFYINGSRNTVTYVGNRSLSIGCHTKKISWFKKNYKILGKREGYTEKEQKEYYGYIKLAEQFYKNLNEINHEL